MKKRNMRIISGILALTLLVSTNVFATTTSEYDAQISEVKAKQEQNEAEAAELNARLDALRSETADAEAYQATLVEQIQNYQESILSLTWSAQVLLASFARFNLANDNDTLLFFFPQTRYCLFKHTAYQINIRAFVNSPASRPSKQSKIEDR